MNELLPYLDQLYEIQNLDMGILNLENENQKIQDEIVLIQKEILSKEMEIKKEEGKWKSLVSSKKRTLEEMKAKITKNLITIRQYESQLKTEKHQPVANLLKKSIAKMGGENDVFEGECKSLQDEIPKVEQELHLRVAYMQESLEGLRVKSTEKTDALELEEIRIAVLIDDLKEDRVKKCSRVPDDVVAEYERMRESAGGMAIAGVTSEESCFACNVQIRVQTLIELKSRKSIVTCESCGRILWIPQ